LKKLKEAEQQHIEPQDIEFTNKEHENIHKPHFKGERKRHSHKNLESVEYDKEALENDFHYGVSLTEANQPSQGSSNQHSSHHTPNHQKYKKKYPPSNQIKEEDVWRLATKDNKEDFNYGDNDYKPPGSQKKGPKIIIRKESIGEGKKPEHDKIIVTLGVRILI
jgi:hypothetical protein